MTRKRSNKVVVETIHTEGHPYLSRVKLLGEHLRFHIFHRGDQDQDHHDHPSDFWTFPLTPYVEEYRNKEGQRRWRVVKAFRLHHRKAEFAHRVLGRWTGDKLADGSPMIEWDDGMMASICWFGKYRRQWGFHTRDGWVRWDIYEGRKRVKARADELRQAREKAA